MIQDTYVRNTVEIVADDPEVAPAVPIGTRGLVLRKSSDFFNYWVVRFDLSTGPCCYDVHTSEMEVE